MRGSTWLLALAVLWLAAHLILRTHRNTVFVAHRGAAGEAPENTLSAVEAGAASGAPFLEIDVRSSRDDVLVVIHDDDLERTTDGQGLVAEYDAEYLRALDAGRWFDIDFEGEPIPTLAEVVASLEGWPGTLVIEVKDPDPDSRTARQLVATTTPNPDLTVMVVSFDHKWLRQFRAEAASIPLGELSVYPLAMPAPSEADRIGVFWLAPLIDPTLLPRAHRSGLEVWVWTVDSPWLQDLLAWMGVDAITTNHPTQAVRRQSGFSLNSR